MKIIKVRSCRECPYFSKEQPFWSNHACHAKGFPQGAPITAPSKVHKDCPLGDLKK